MQRKLDQFGKLQLFQDRHVIDVQEQRVDLQRGDVLGDLEQQPKKNARRDACPDRPVQLEYTPYEQRPFLFIV